MPFTDAVSNVSGRNSRASNVSGATGASRSAHSPPPPPDALANAGVLSMLKTSTDTGDIGALSFNTSRLPGMPRATHQRRGYVPRPSASVQHISGATSNHSYAPSQTSRISSQWDAASATQRRGSFTSMQSMPPSLPPMHAAKPPLTMIPSMLDDPRGSRSFSMTSAAPREPLPRHRSAASLKSQGHEPRHLTHMPQGTIPSMPENRPPFVYPTRLKRPGYRSPSPALSDIYASGTLPGPPPMPGRQQIIPPMITSPPPEAPAFPLYPNGYSTVCPQDSHHLNVRPPPRPLNSSSGLYETGPYGFRASTTRPPGMPGIHQPLISPLPHPIQHRGHLPAPHHGPSRPPYAPYAYVQRPSYRGPPPSSTIPMAHSMFHNAARMARQIPHRSDTPMADTGILSSDPPSSSSAPSSSNPPTPKDHTAIQGMVDPAFINPDLIDLPDSSSEPVLPAKYFDYADGLEKPIHEPEIEVPHPSIPPSGFVQRVKAMLESKAAVEAAAIQHERDNALRPEHGHEREVVHESDISELADYHELAANETPRFTVIEEFQAPVELPASPVKIAELEAVELTEEQQQRITREMVKAELGPSSVDNTLHPVSPDDSTTHLIITMQHRDEKEVAMPMDFVSGHRHDSDVTAHVSPQLSDAKNINACEPGADTESEAASLPTAAGYAVRFSGPVDTSVASHETHSRDPFVLDADTVTLEQQRRSATQEDLHGTQSSNSSHQIAVAEQFHRPLSGPVSPIRSDEDIRRTSAVSPIQTEVTLGIDETLRLVSESKTRTLSDEEQCASGASQLADSMLPPTPRAAKTYSKSVQLPPQSAFSDSTNSGTHRFSLPGDLSSIADSTFNTASELVTDVAVRFSLPRSSIATARPQIVDLCNNSTPDNSEPDRSMHRRQSTARNGKPTRRSSVAFVDEIAPLIIVKPGHCRPVLPNANGASVKGKSIMRRSSGRDESHEPRAVARENTSELHFSNNPDAVGAGVRFGSTHLPGLKEESIEDMSISDHKRSSTSDHFLLPARIAAVKALQERRLQETVEKVKARRQARQHNHSLAQIRDLPSLNFSRIDLVDRLNEALEIRPTKSMDIIRRRDFSNIYCPSPQRPQSTEPLRERYTSFFNKPEDFGFFNEYSSDDESIEPDDEYGLVPTVHVQGQTETDVVELDKRSLSPEDFLNVATQVQRLSIPTVSGLSERISELIPGLRNLSSFRLDSIFSTDQGNLFSVKGNELVRPDTIMTTRTSAGFRALAERAEEIVKNGTHDSLKLLTESMNKDLPPLPESQSADKLSAISPAEGKQSYLSGSVSAPVGLGKEPVRHSSALVRTRAPTTEEEVERMLPKEMNPITRNSNRVTTLSHPTSRPWNLDENYPWSGDKVEIDLSVPSVAHTRNSVASDILRERRTKSLDLICPVKPKNTTKGIDIGSITMEHLDSASVTTEQATGVPSSHARKQSKRSIIGSISKKFGLASRTTADEDTTNKNVPISPLLPRRSSTRQSHKPGDRYPTSSLTPPAAFNLDEVRSFFSDNSSERDHTGSFRKRLTHFKSKRLARPEQTTCGQSLDGDTTYNAGTLIDDDRLGANSRAHTYDGIAMSKTEFHIKRFGEKLRNLLAKGGELIRSFSVRREKRQEEAQDAWLADSVYSGV